MASLTEQLTEATTDLYYPSESEYPLEPFVWKREEKIEEEKKSEPKEEETSKKKKDKDEGKVETVSESSSTDKTKSFSPTTADDVLKFGKYKDGTKIKEISIEDFFERTTKIEDWFGDEENAIAQKFSDLQKLIESSLQKIKVFRVGEIEIDVYVVGVDADGNFAGLKTTVVET